MPRRINARFKAANRFERETEQVAASSERIESPQQLSQIELTTVLSIYIRDRSELPAQAAYRCLRNFLVAYGAEQGILPPSLAVEFTQVLIAGADVGINMLDGLEPMGPAEATKAASLMLEQLGVEPRPLSPEVNAWAADSCSSYIPPMPGPANTGTI